MKIYPKKRLGKWAVGMTLLFILLIAVFFFFMAIGLVDFNTGHWWDITVGVAAPVELIAFILSIMAIRKEQTVLTYCSLILEILTVLFILTHSLYIHD
jgi:cytochrome bd-type quinol oxidase subunit 2